MSGVIGVHVDGVLFAGSESFHDAVTDKLESVFRFTKMKIDDFTFTGSRITKLPNGDIKVDQEEYLENVDVNDIPRGSGKRFLEGNEIKEFREYIGKINWVAQMTDPTVA